MKHTTKLLLGALALGTMTSLGIAQENSNPPAHRPHPAAHADGIRPEGRRMHGPPMVAALDANRDGTIDAGELANAPAALQTLDRNGDGTLASDELAPPRPPRPPHAPAPAHVPEISAEHRTHAVKPAEPAGPVPPPPPSLITGALDANQDAVIDATELANASAALLSLDQNGDGQLTPEEVQPQRRGRPGAGAAQKGRRPAPRHTTE